MPYRERRPEDFYTLHQQAGSIKLLTYKTSTIEHQTLGRRTLAQSTPSQTSLETIAHLHHSIQLNHMEKSALTTLQ